MSGLQVNILSPAKTYAKVPSAQQVYVPGALGYLGILPGHARLVTELGTGEMVIDAAGGKQIYFVSGGYIDVSNDTVTVLADTIERQADIDVARAEKAKARALDQLSKKTEVDVARAQAALLRANKRLLTVSVSK